MILPVVAEVPRDRGPQVHQPRAREDARQHEVAPLLVGVEPVAARPDERHQQSVAHHLLGGAAHAGAALGRSRPSAGGAAHAGAAHSGRRGRRRRELLDAANKRAWPRAASDRQRLGGANWLSSLALCTALGLPRYGKDRHNSRGGQPPATLNRRGQQAGAAARGRAARTHSKRQRETSRAHTYRRAADKDAPRVALPAPRHNDAHCPRRRRLNYWCERRHRRRARRAIRPRGLRRRRRVPQPERPRPPVSIKSERRESREGPARPRRDESREGERLRRRAEAAADGRRCPGPRRRRRDLAAVFCSLPGHDGADDPWIVGLWPRS
mmetsp:Transcript_5147/g.14922  ORF Transcript_5147/g.14922 Transcript_5147/m.14922 type:complete len:325 (+) Transcript_5147:449-1423(+)